MGEDRQGYPRACRPLDVTLDASGQQWGGNTVNLSPYGAKVALPEMSVPLAPGTNIGLWLTLPDGDLFLRAVVDRTDPDGVALNFDRLEDGEFQRLKDLVDSLLIQEWRALLAELQGDEPVPVLAELQEDEPVPETVPPETPESPPPESAEAPASVAPDQPSLFARQRARAHPPKPPVTPAEDDLDTDRLRELVGRLGLGDVQLPPGPLTGPWREFLKQLEAQEK